MRELPPGVKATTGGTFDPASPPVYYLATNPSNLRKLSDNPAASDADAALNEHVLVAVNELDTKAAREAFTYLLQDGRKVLLDSGIFALSTGHARRHHLTMDEALALAPEEVDGFAELYDRYCTLVSEHADRLWGVIELDQGGADNKRRTRARLEQDLPGFVPMPVYHPLNDGWEYLDELAQGYDRICAGNVVQAPSPVRTKLLAAFYERAGAYPYLWVHVLGYTPTGTTSSVPPQGSCDSSSWLTATRWLAADKLRAMLHPWTRLTSDDRFTYRRGEELDSPVGVTADLRLNAYRARMVEQTWRAIREERAAHGLLVQPHLAELYAAHGLEVR